MGSFRIETPDGKKYRVEAPDAESAAKAVEEMMGATSAPPPAAAAPAGPSVAEDMLKAGGSGLVTGLHGLAGLGGDIDELARGAGSWIGNQARALAGKEPGVTPERLTALPTSEDAMAATGWDKARYVPQTVPGKVAGAVGEFIPGGAALGGGLVKAAKAGTAALQATKNAGKFGAVPGVVSEGAGQAVEALGMPDAGPIARMGGALVGAGAGSMLKKAPKPTVTAEGLKAEARVGYDASTASGALVFEPASITNIVNDISRATWKEGINPSTPKAWAALKEFEALAGVAPDLGELDRVRKMMGQAKKSPDDTERFFGSLLTKKLDDYLDNLKPADIISGSPKEAVNALVKARSQWNKARKAETIEELMERAKDKVGANYTTAGLMTAVRQEFKALKRRSDFKLRFRPDERAAITEIIRGGAAENVVRLISKMDIRSPIVAGLFGATAASGSPLLAGGLAVAGGVAKFASSRKAAKNVQKLEEMILSGKAPPRDPASMLPALGTYYGNSPGQSR